MYLVRSLLVASVGIPAALFGVLAQQSRQEAIQAAHQHVAQTTALAHAHAQKVLEINTAALDRVAHYLATQRDWHASDSRADLHNFLAGIQQGFPSIQSLWVFADDGRPLAQSAVQDVSQAPTAAQRIYFRFHRENPVGGHFLSRPLDFDTGPQFAVTRRLNGPDGHFAGVATSGVYADYFLNNWRTLEPQLGSSTALIREDGALLVRYPPASVNTVPNSESLVSDPEVLARLRNNEAAVFELQSPLDGQLRIVGVRAIQGYPVVLSHSITMDAVLAGWHRTLATYGALCALAAFALTGMSLLVRRRVINERQLLQQLRETTAARTRFFANVSHELRTPLTLVLGPLQRLLDKDSLAPEERRELKMAQRNARMLQRRVDDLLEVARLEAGNTRLNYVRTDAATLVRLVAAPFQPLAGERNMRFEIDLPHTLEAEFDPIKLEHVLLNLLSNAFKFTPEGGWVHLALTEEPGDALRIAVQDNGPGIPPAMRKAVFERFRLVEDGPERSPRGTGLGLAIVKEFVELHGGTVVLDDAPHGGTLVELRLPRHAPPEAEVTARPAIEVLARLEPEQEARGLVGAATTVPPPRAPHVLVVEDHPDMRTFVAEGLGREFRVTATGSAEEALRLAASDPPDLVVTDAMLPRMSGVRLVQALHANTALQDVPVLMLTARTDDEFQAKALRSGVQDFLGKPFSMAVLQARIERLLLERERAAMRQRLSEERLAGILQTARDAIVVADAQHRIVLFNAAAEQAFGCPADVVRGQSVRRLMAPDTWRQYLEDVHELETRDGDRGPLVASTRTGEARRANATKFPVECSISRAPDAGSGAFYTLILRDITDRLRESEALAQAHHEMQQMAHRFEEELLQAVERRQRHIARELHDAVGSAMAGVSLLLGGVRAQTLASSIGPAIEKAHEHIVRTTDLVREISRGMVPAGTERGALLQALEQFAHTLTEVNGVTSSVRARGSLDQVEPDVATHVYRIVQEAATNGMRHGGADVLRIHVAQVGECWRVTVLDNGSGCDPEKLTRMNAGMGIRSMHARARAIGARLELGLRPSGGCRVRLTWTQPARASMEPPTLARLTA